MWVLRPISALGWQRKFSLSGHSTLHWGATPSIAESGRVIQWPTLARCHIRESLNLLIGLCSSNPELIVHLQRRNPAGAGRYAKIGNFDQLRIK